MTSTPYVQAWNSLDEILRRQHPRHRRDVDEDFELFELDAAAVALGYQPRHRA